MASRRPLAAALVAAALLGVGLGACGDQNRSRGNQGGGVPDVRAPAGANTIAVTTGPTTIPAAPASNAEGSGAASGDPSSSGGGLSPDDEQ